MMKQLILVNARPLNICLMLIALILALIALPLMKIVKTVMKARESLFALIVRVLTRGIHWQVNANHAVISIHNAIHVIF